MLILAADTSGRHGSIALAQCGPGADCSIVDLVPLAGGTFSAQLVPQIAALLSKHGFSKDQIDGFAVASGPGSFTGLRVGLAAIKGLAEVLQKPIAAVSLLEALAVRSGVEGTVLAVLDAGRNEVYAGEYDVCGNSVRLTAETLMPRAEFFAQRPPGTIVTSDSALAADARSANSKVVETEPIRSDVIAQLGWQKIQTGQTLSAEDLVAIYIRRSDAVIFSKPA
jgi:tRNA threonylcarbamoyladenosine biosynthesis protein TsaB